MASLIYQKAPEAYSSLVSHYQRTSRTTIAFSFSLACLLGLAPSAYRDYKTFMSYGPGGAPYNVFGWLVVTTLLRPLASEMFSTDMYDRNEDKKSWLSAGDLTIRGERPVVGPHVVPQRQLNQVPGKEIKEKLVAAFDSLYHKNEKLVKVSPSLFEKHTDALFLVDDITSSPISAELREISHIHGTSDHSVHVTLSPMDCKAVIQSGWGQRHPLDGSKGLKRLTGMWLPKQYIFIYAPRNDQEIEIVMRIVKASVGYMTGSKDVR